MSTNLPQLFWTTIDKATPSRTTNQAILIVARDSSGTPCPIHVDAPKVYKVLYSGSYAALAKMVINSLRNNFGETVLSQLAAVSTNGLYQTPSFKKRLLELLGLQDMNKNSQLILLELEKDG